MTPNFIIPTQVVASYHSPREALMLSALNKSKSTHIFAMGSISALPHRGLFKTQALSFMHGNVSLVLSSDNLYYQEIRHSSNNDVLFATDNCINELQFRQ